MIVPVQGKPFAVAELVPCCFGMRLGQDSSVAYHQQIGGEAQACIQVALHPCNKPFIISQLLFQFGTMRIRQGRC